MANFQIHSGNLSGMRMKRHKQQVLMKHLIRPLAWHCQHLPAWRRQRQLDLH
jgi:hypothetical protein